MQRINKLSFLLMGLAGTILLNSCDKTKPYEITVPPAQAHFTAVTGATSKYLPYYVTNSANSTFDIVIGTTDVSQEDRTVTYKISSPSGAVAGTHYTVVSPTGGNTVIIPAGQATAKVTIHGIFAPYATGARRDTLFFTLDKPSVEVAKFADTLKLVLQRYCNVDLTALTGNYTRTFDYIDGSQDWGPYLTSITDPTPGTNGNGISKDTIRIANFYDYGFPLDVILDWNNPANFTATVINGQRIGTHTTYGAMFANNRAGSTFSSCDQTFTINYTVFVGAGTFSNQFQTRLAR